MYRENREAAQPKLHRTWLKRREKLGSEQNIKHSDDGVLQTRQAGE
jgi:hypothetical protein